MLNQSIHRMPPVDTNISCLHTTNASLVQLKFCVVPYFHKYSFIFVYNLVFNPLSMPYNQDVNSLYIRMFSILLIGCNLLAL